MKEIINVMSRLNLLALLLVFGLSILAFKYKFKQLRNNKNKKVTILAIKDTNRILVKNNYYFLLKIDFWKKIFKSSKIIKYMENEREICLIAIPNSKSINDKRQDQKIEKILKKYINKVAKIKYRFLRNRELPLFQKIVLIRNYYGFKEKIKYFLSIFEFNYDYYFSVISEKIDISKEIIEETGIWDKNENFSFFKFFKYNEVIKKAKKKAENKEYNNKHNADLKAVQINEKIEEKLEE
jgi:hypothetical protein